MDKRDRNESSRREFIRKTSLVGLGITTSMMSSCKEKEPQEATKEPGFLNEQSKKIMGMFNLKYPIFKAAPGGLDLALAVANAGGMGAIAYLNTDEIAKKKISKMEKLTNGNYYVNYILHWPPDTLDAALEAGCKTFEFSWGVPTTEVVSKIRNAGARFGVQVSSKLNAKRALEDGPDFLFCQGLEAGGHIQASMSLKHALSEILEISNDIPVLVAGGISTGHDIREVINMGGQE